MNLIHYDQFHRAVFCLLGLTGAIFFGWCVDRNQTGLHGYYRDRLAATFLEREHTKRPEVFPEPESESLSMFRIDKRGAPYPIFQTSVLLNQSWVHADQLERPFEPFILSPGHCGNSTFGYIKTGNGSDSDDSSEQGRHSTLGKREPTLADAMAISGGAIDPAYFVHHFLAFVTNIINWRMGQLFPNPSYRSWPRPSMLREGLQRLRQLRSQRDTAPTPRNLLLTDGGHSENLGIEPLLERRCKLIIVCDAGHDPDHVLDDLSRVTRRLESTHGIRLADVIPSACETVFAGEQRLRIPGNMAGPIGGVANGTAAQSRREQFDRLFRRPEKESGASKKHYFVAKILYPECGRADTTGRCENPAAEGRLVYIKPCLTGDEGIQLYNYAFRHQHFPHESTLDQAFDETQFEAYRKLGIHSGDDLCRHLHDPASPSNASAPTVAEGSDKPQLWSKENPPHLEDVCRALLQEDNFRMKTDVVRAEVESSLVAFREERLDSREFASQMESYGPDISCAADLLVTLDFDGPDCPLFSTAYFFEHFDERAIPWLAHAIASHQDDAVRHRAVIWIYDLILSNEDWNADDCLEPIQQYAIETKHVKRARFAVNVLAYFAATENPSRARARVSLRRVREQATGEASEAAKKALDRIDQTQFT